MTCKIVILLAIAMTCAFAQRQPSVPTILLKLVKESEQLRNEMKKLVGTNEAIKANTDRVKEILEEVHTSDYFRVMEKAGPRTTTASYGW